MSEPSPQLPTVSFDASLSAGSTTGIGLYSRLLPRALEGLGLTVERLAMPASSGFLRGTLARNLWTVAELPQVLARSGTPLFHAVGNFNLPLMPVAGTKFVLTVHDLIPLRAPETVSVRYRWQFRLWLSRSVRIADRIVCDSHCTYRDLVEWFPAAAAKSEVIHLGVDHVRAGAVDVVGEAYVRTLGLPSAFVLYAGSLDVRKNVALLLDACERLRSAGRRVSVVLLGQSWHGSQSAERRIARMRADGFDIRPLGFQADAVFYELIRRASVFVFPSRYEGFGLPPLEAMSLGVPTIISTAGALPEVCGDAAVQVDPNDADGLAAAMARLLDSPDERRTRSEGGRRHAAPFTWERTARQTVEVYRSALEERRHD